MRLHEPVHSTPSGRLLDLSDTQHALQLGRVTT
jgi:hypothetical protein